MKIYIFHPCKLKFLGSPLHISHYYYELAKKLEESAKGNINSGFLSIDNIRSVICTNINISPAIDKVSREVAKHLMSCVWWDESLQDGKLWEFSIISSYTEEDDCLLYIKPNSYGGITGFNEPNRFHPIFP